MSNKVCFEYQLHWSEISSSKTERYRLVVETSIERPLTVTRPEHADTRLFLEMPGPTGEPHWVDISGGEGAGRLMAPVLLRMFDWATNGSVGAVAGKYPLGLRENEFGVRFVNLGLLSYE